MASSELVDKEDCVLPLDEMGTKTIHLMDPEHLLSSSHLEVIQTRIPPLSSQQQSEVMAQPQDGLNNGQR
jgi:hypothetical protein